MEQINDSQKSNSIEKALDVLFFLHHAVTPVGVTALAKGLAMPKSSVHRLLSSLARRNLVERDDRGKYQVGFALIALGLGALQREPVAAVAHSLLEAAAADLGETFFLVIARGGQLVVLDKAEGSGFLRAAPQVGSTVPLHASAVGKLYLAFAPDQIPRPTEFPAFTDKTVTNIKQLNEAVKVAQKQAWASNIDEWIPGLAVLAAPVLRAEQMVATVALAMVTARLLEQGIEPLRQRVQVLAQSIGLRLEGKT